MSKLFPPTPSGADIRLAVIGGCGEYQSGKTLFGLTIAPGVHDDGPYQGKSRTLCLDFEKSATTYTGTGADILDVNDRLTANKPGYTPRDVFLWFREIIESIAPERYDVIMVDTITDIETGMYDEIKASPSKYGLTAGQVAKSEALVWGKLKTLWKDLLLKLAAKCETFYFTAHMRNQFSGGAPSKKREPKGKEVLMEIANLYLQFDRSPDRKTRLVPDVPRAVVLKHRLADTAIDPTTGEVRITPLIPPAFEVCTIAKLRDYIAKGVNYSRNAKELRIDAEPELTEAEKLSMEMAVADRRVEAAALEIELRENDEETAERRAKVLEQRKREAHADETTALQKETPRPSATPLKEGNPPFEVECAPEEPTSDVEINEGDWNAILASRLETASPIRRAKAKRMLTSYGAASFAELSPDDAKAVADTLL